MNIEQQASNAKHPRAVPASARDVGCWISDVGCFLLVLFVRLYRLTLSPTQTFLFGPSAGCRFTPSCSQYAIEALQTHGPARGSWLTAKRICRCHPWGDCGHDPVPKALTNPVTKRQSPLRSSLFARPARPPHN